MFAKMNWGNGILTALVAKDVPSQSTTAEQSKQLLFWLAQQER